MVALYKWESDEVKTYIGYDLRCCFFLSEVSVCMRNVFIHSIIFDNL